MAATTRPSDPGRADRVAPLVRFDRTERVLHWVVATAFVVLMVTAAMLYVAPLSARIGQRPLVRSVHLWVGLFLPVPLVVARLGPWSAGLRADVARLARFDAADRRWVRALGRDRRVALGKFHPLQKLNAAFVAGAIGVMVATGVVMYWFRLFPLAWRTGATFVHDWLALALFVAIGLHVNKALGDREALRGMWHGRVSLRWARRRHPGWAAELIDAAPAPTQGVDTGPTSDSQEAAP